MLGKVVKRLSVAYMETGPVSEGESVFLEWGREVLFNFERRLASRAGNCDSDIGSC